MKVILDVKDSKADFFMELISNFSFIKVKTITPVKAQVLHELREAVVEMNLINVGEKKARNAEEFLNEL